MEKFSTRLRIFVVVGGIISTWLKSELRHRIVHGRFCHPSNSSKVTSTFVEHVNHSCTGSHMLGIVCVQTRLPCGGERKNKKQGGQFSVALAMRSKAFYEVHVKQFSGRAAIGAQRTRTEAPTSKILGLAWLSSKDQESCMSGLIDYVFFGSHLQGCTTKVLFEDPPFFTKLQNLFAKPDAESRRSQWLWKTVRPSLNQPLLQANNCLPFPACPRIQAHHPILSIRHGRVLKRVARLLDQPLHHQYRKVVQR